MLLKNGSIGYCNCKCESIGNIQNLMLLRFMSSPSLIVLFLLNNNRQYLLSVAPTVLPLNHEVTETVSSRRCKIKA